MNQVDKTLKKITGFTVKTYWYLKGNIDEDKNAKRHKQVCDKKKT